MSRELSTNILNGKDGGSEPIYMIKLIGDSNTYRWGTKEIYINGDSTYIGGRLKRGGLPTLEQSIDIFGGGGVGNVGNFKIRLLNQDEYHDTLDFVNNHYENRQIEVYIVYDNGSLSTSDWGCLQKGIVKKIEYDIDEIIFHCIDIGEQRHKNIPSDKINKDDYPNCPEDNVGKVMQLLYGNLYSGYRRLDNFKAVPTILVDEAKHKYLISGNQCKALDQEQYSYSLLFDENTKTFVSLMFGVETSPPETITYDRPTTIQFPLDKMILGHVIKQCTTQGEKTSAGIDITNAIDDDDDTYVTLSGGDKLYLKVDIPDMFEIVEGTYIDLWIKFGTIDGSSGDAGTRKYYNPNFDNGTGAFSTGETFGTGDAGYTKKYTIQSTAGGDPSAHGKMDDQSDQNNPWTFGEINSCEFGLEVDSGYTVQIKNIFIAIEYALIRKDAFKWQRMSTNPGRNEVWWYWWHYRNPEAIENEINNLAVRPDGVKFGSWIDADSRNNGYNQNDLVEYGAYIIEEILRTELGLVSADINYQSFDIIGNDTDGKRKWNRLAGIITEEKNSIDIIDEICKNLAIGYFTDYNGKEKVINWIGETTTSRTINLIKLTNTEKGKSSINIELSNLKYIYTHYNVRYKKNFVTGNYEGLKYSNPDGQNLGDSYYQTQCSNAETNFNQKNVFNFESNWIQDDVSAAELTKRLIDFFTTQHYIIELTTSLNALDVELGDLVRISHPILPSNISNTKVFVVTSVRINCQKDEINLRFVQVEP